MTVSILLELILILNSFIYIYCYVKWLLSVKEMCGVQLVFDAVSVLF